MSPGASSLLVIDPHSHDQLQGFADAIPQKRIWERSQAVLLAKRGWTAPLIARSLGCSPRAVKNWVAQYNCGGIEALRERPRSGRPRRLAPEHDPRLRRRLDAPPRAEDGVCTLRGADVRRILGEGSGALMGLRAVYDLLHRLGYGSLMPRPQHEDASPEVQEIFREVAAEQIEAIGDEHPGREVRVHFEDEARFGTQGTIARAWAPKGSRPRAVRQDGREWLYVPMAVCVDTGAASAPILPELNVAVLNLFPEQFARSLPAGVHAVLIWDGAGYHTGGDLRVPGDVSLIRLPPYWPGLTPVEDLWHSLRAHHWSNREYGGYEGPEEEAVRSLCAVCNDADGLKRICHADYVRRSA